MHAFGRQQRRRDAFDIRKVVHEIIDRPQFVIERVDQYLAETALGLAGKQ